MKWTNKGHQFDVEGNYLAEEFSKRKNIYIFGAGIFGAELQQVLEKYDCFGGYIDNDLRKQKEGANGYSVISLEEFLRLNDNAWIVVAVRDEYMDGIARQIEEAGMLKNKDFFTLTHFCSFIFPLVSMYFFNRLFVEMTQLSLTERCTLRCVKCAHACGYVSRKAEDMEIADVYSSVDTYFKNVDVVKEFALIGGEPLLYKDLVQAVEYIGEKYRDQIGVFSITTNGTIMPSQELLEVCKKHKVLLRISNYSRQIVSLKEKYQKMLTVLEANKVSYLLGEEEHEWMDYGFDHLNREASEEELIRVFDACKTPCSEIRNNRYYRCIMARSVSENMKLSVDETEFLEMKELHGATGRKIMFEYTMGCSEKGYLDMCNYCYGAEAKMHPIPAAEQM